MNFISDADMNFIYYVFVTINSGVTLEASYTNPGCTVEPAEAWLPSSVATMYTEHVCTVIVRKFVHRPVLVLSSDRCYF